MDFNIKTKDDLINLIEEAEYESESMYKRDAQCRMLLRRDGKLYMLEYMRSYENGVDPSTAEVYEVVEKVVTRIDYIRVPKEKTESKGPAACPPKAPSA